MCVGLNLRKINVGIDNHSSDFQNFLPKLFAKKQMLLNSISTIFCWRLLKFFLLHLIFYITLLFLNSCIQHVFTNIFMGESMQSVTAEKDITINLVNGQVYFTITQ